MLFVYGLDRAFETGEDMKFMVIMAILFVIGLGGLFPLLSGRRFDLSRTVDKIQLVASVACLLAAVIMLVISLRRT
jgi:hypothetical protein